MVPDLQHLLLSLLLLQQLLMLLMLPPLPLNDAAVAVAAAAAGKYSVPVLWDKKENVIVNNESSEILRMFNASFNNLAQNPDMDLYPQDLRAKIDEVRGGGVRWG
jgi:hypothetical protein